jgi:short subunit dehydrogenase-like uncharacterized protein
MRVSPDDEIEHYDGVMTERRFDIILFGATGFTGKLVAGYLATKKLRWAIAGRDRGKLEQLRAQLGAPSLDVIVADALDAAAIANVATQTRVVCTTAGPYAKYGSALVAACAEAGTHYCDLTGEVQWMRHMIDAHHERAKATGARIVHACGFDSVPSDMGTWALQQEMIARFGAPARTVTAVFGELKGGFSGGTAASGLGTAEAADTDPAIRDMLANPYSLDPDLGASRPAVPTDKGIGWNRRLGRFTVPFVMAPVNTRVVRRGHALAGYPYGDDFIYREVMSTPGNPRGLAMAIGVTMAIGGFAALVKRKRLRALIERRAPKPGEGPPPEVRAAGHWKVRLVGERDGESLVYIAADRADPGYDSTSKMLGESAMCLALDPLTSSGGVTTPAVAMGGALLARLRAAGLTFEADTRRS